MATKTKTAPKPAAKKAAASKNTAAPKGSGLKIHPDKAHEALGVLADYVEERVELAKDKARLGNAVGAIKIMHALDTLKDDVATRLKTPLEAAYNTMRFNIVPEFMEAEEIDKITVEGVGRVNVADDIRVVVADKDGLREWLIENDLEDMIVPQVNAQTLTAFVRQAMKDGKIQDGKGLPDGKILTVTPFVRAAITAG